MDVLERYKDAKENAEEKHLCPLQLEVIRRCIKLYSAPGQLVMDPFMGVGSTAVVANEQDRDCVGFELKESYHRMSVQNVRDAKRPDSQMNMHTAIAAAKKECAHA
jgi:DNA modification methylase